DGPVRFRDGAAPDLAAHVLADRLLRLLDMLGVDIDQLDGITLQGCDMGDSVAHLAAADDADRSDHGGEPAPICSTLWSAPAPPGTGRRRGRNRRPERSARPRHC